MNLPCGCEQRKDIMFKRGNMDLATVLLVAIPLSLVAFLVVRKYAA